jgi:hypothetical protein
VAAAAADAASNPKVYPYIVHPMSCRWAVEYVIQDEANMSRAILPISKGVK